MWAGQIYKARPGLFPNDRLPQTLSRSSKPYQVHCARNLAILHEPTPNVPGPRVLSAQQCDPEINSNDVPINPVSIWVEGVAESVSAVDALAVFFPYRAQCRQRQFRNEHQGATDGIRNDRSVDCRIAWRSTPGDITFNAV